MKKKDIIKLVVICLVFLILFVTVMFVLLKDRVQTPYESDNLTRLVDIYEVKKITKTSTHLLKDKALDGWEKGGRELFYYLCFVLLDV